MSQTQKNYPCKLLAILILCIAGSLANSESSYEGHRKTLIDPGEPLLLTPIIRSGEHGRAQDLALVSEFAPIVSYSGFITVNESLNSNIFFWYFPSEASTGAKDNNDIPVVLWNDGGPGSSCMNTIFGEMGPFLGSQDGTNYTINPLSWHKKYHMIFMDNPVTVGFSHTDNENGYVYSPEQAAEGIYEFLTQFFTMFPHLQPNPFYNAGGSYGGTYASQVASLIHHQNLNSPPILINLTGAIMDCPWIDGFTQTRYGEVLFGAGVISQANRDEFLRRENEIRTVLTEERWSDATELWINLTQIVTPNITGYPALYHLENDSPQWRDMTAFITLNSTRKAIHVGNIHFELSSVDQLNRMQDHFMRPSSAAKLDEVLQNGYRLLLYVGNMDVITGHMGIRKLFESLTWEGRDEFINGERTLWKVDDRPAGYITSSGNATLVLMRNAGHPVYMDQPGWVLEAVSGFLG